MDKIHFRNFLESQSDVFKLLLLYKQRPKNPKTLHPLSEMTKENSESSHKELKTVSNWCIAWSILVSKIYLYYIWADYNAWVVVKSTMKITVSLHSLLLISCLCYMSWSQVCDTHNWSIIPTNISKLAAMLIFRIQPQKIKDQSSSKQKDRYVFCCRLQSDITASRVTICLYSNVNCVTT